MTWPVQTHLDALVANPNLAPFLSLVKGARNGVVFGTKVRFPHALVYGFISIYVMLLL